MQHQHVLRVETSSQDLPTVQIQGSGTRSLRRLSVQYEHANHQWRLRFGELRNPAGDVGDELEKSVTMGWSEISMTLRCLEFFVALLAAREFTNLALLNIAAVENRSFGSALS